MYYNISGMRVYKCKDTKEVVIGYDAYLHTKHWKLKRKHIYKIRNKTCELCKKKINYNEPYNVHHKTYDRVGNEKDKDLMLLCPECHNLIHSKKGRIPNILSFVKRYLFNRNDKSQTRNRRTTEKRQNNKNGNKSSSKNQKNHGRIIENKQNHKKFMLPSEQYVQYEKDCCYFVSPKHVKIDIPLNIKCLYYMPTKGRVDKTNLESAVMDMLVHYGVIKDDNSTIVVSTDGSRVKYDKENPRTEIYISYQPNL